MLTCMALMDEIVRGILFSHCDSSFVCKLLLFIIAMTCDKRYDQAAEFRALYSVLRWQRCSSHLWIIIMQQGI